MGFYDHKAIEPKWQKFWETEQHYQSEIDHQRPKYYVLEMFPYPSGRLHMGHMRVYSIGDVLARFLRMRGYNVLHPMGWDAFGLPAENAAIEREVDPAQWTKQNISIMKRQQKSLGVSYDWNREVTTCLPDYYRWTQWLFLLFYKRGLAYKKKSTVNWCPDCKTVLANEQVIDGECWRCGNKVSGRELEQWFLRITDYADRLLEDLAILEGWPERVKIMQENWIGRSEGAEIIFPIKGFDDVIKVFTTRPDTIYGVTYMVLAPEHPLVLKLVKGTPYEKEIISFVNKMRLESDISRTAAETEKIGLFTGSYVVNPVNGEEVPILVGNYVLMEYGTGAVMGVPAHDERDFLFAHKYNLPIKVVIQPPDKDLINTPLTEAYIEPGVLVNSGPFDGLSSEKAIWKITDFLKEKKWGGHAVSYRLRDWLISRQRYWGAPIPIVYCDKCGIVPIPEKQLPVKLPHRAKFKKGGQSPLQESEEFVNTICPKCGGPARRETDTMDTFICSSWYFLRYVSPHNNELPFSTKEADYWMPVDQYIGGIEHAVLHLLYARFFIKVLYDAELISVKEPFKRLLAQGMVYKDGAKMSKSKGNVVTPDEIVDSYGADTGRLFILFAAPPEKDLDWNYRGVEGCHRFLRRVWRLINQHSSIFEEKEFVSNLDPKDRKLRRILHTTIKKVTEDIEKRFNFNTAISAIMELLNQVNDYIADKSETKVNRGVLQETLEQLVLILSPFAPHITEELWERMGHKESVHHQKWPVFDVTALSAEEVEMVIQVNGKMRGKIIVPVDFPEESLIEIAQEHDRVKPLLKGKQVMKTITVPQKLVNIVAK